MSNLFLNISSLGLAGSIEALAAVATLIYLSRLIYLSSQLIAEDNLASYAKRSLWHQKVCHRFG